LTLYLRLVSAAGIAVLVALAVTGIGDLGPADAEFWVLAALVLAGELFPIQFHGVSYENFSTPFAFALLLVYGLPEAVAVQVAASLVSDVVRRRPLEHVLFNAAQLAISWVAAGIALDAVGGSDLRNGDDLEAADLPGIAFSAAVFFIVNSTLAGTAEALLEHTSIAHLLRRDLPVRIWSAGTLFALSLPVAVVSMHWLYLVPLLVLPMAAVHRALTQASEMEHLALHDALTGLPNRALLLQTAARALDGANGDQELALLVVDLDRFRDVNDTLGRAQGDAVLKEVAARLTRSVRATDLVARIESDRFGVLLPDLARSGDAALAADKILGELSQQMEVAGAALSVDATVGIACAPSHAQEADLLLQRAEAAMYRAKRAQARREFFSLDIEDEAPRRLILVTALKRAIDARAITMHYQPKVALSDRRVIGVEALARWTDEVVGPVLPATFVPLAERTGLAEPLTELALETAAADCRRWQNDGHYTPVAVNVPARVLLDPAFPDLVESKRRTFGLEEGALEIEITESTLMGDHDQARRALTRLREIGVRASIDDFGTGYSSLSYLRELPVQFLKIDRSFITRLIDEPDLEAIVRSIVELARNLRLETVAEGVEDEGVCDRLVRLGCDYAQGFALARPMPAEAMRTWLRARVTVD
jgi:diguanylate cyclase (GGDEF)-like protein